MWGRTVYGSCVRCRKHAVCELCGKTRAEQSCICDTAVGEQCAIRHKWGIDFGSLIDRGHTSGEGCHRGDFCVSADRDRLLLVDGRSVRFNHKLRGGERVAGYPEFERPRYLLSREIASYWRSRKSGTWFPRDHRHLRHCDHLRADVGRVTVDLLNIRRGGASRVKSPGGADANKVAVFAPDAVVVDRRWRGAARHGVDLPVRPADAAAHLGDGDWSRGRRLRGVGTEVQGDPEPAEPPTRVAGHRRVG